MISLRCDQWSSHALRMSLSRSLFTTTTVRTLLALLCDLDLIPRMLGPGPARYNLRKRMGATSAVMPDAPHYSFGGARQRPPRERPSPGPGTYDLKTHLADRKSHRQPCLEQWSAPATAKVKAQALELLPRAQLSGLLRPSEGTRLLPIGNLPALLRIASQNPALAEAFQERCETLADANPALVPFIEELYTSAGLGLVRTSVPPAPS
jgi:hypothetical protein